MAFIVVNGGQKPKKGLLLSPSSSDAHLSSNGIPLDCPFSIRPMNKEKSLFVIRENDRYGEYPNIYAKIVSPASHQLNESNVKAASLIVLCDTGCGTSVELGGLHTRVDAGMKWNIGSFLEATINPQNYLPYLVITSHCHYDHILGMKELDLSRIRVLSSAYDKSFVTPRSHLAKHSLCTDLGIATPKYNVSIWAQDLQTVVVTPPHSSQPISTGITILQTPGHTPDSLAWYDSTLSPPRIFVGDSLYERQSEDTKYAQWGREPPMPTIFNADSNLADWSRSMNKVLKFVQDRNRELEINACESEGEDLVVVSQVSGQGASALRVMLGAAHVTVSVDAENCVLAMLHFMHRVLQDEVPHCRVKGGRGNEVWLWDDTLDADLAKYGNRQEQAKLGRFSVRAPLSVIEKERRRIVEDSFRCDNVEMESPAT